MGALPKDYEVPGSGAYYLNSIKEKIRLRIIKGPVIGTEYWVSTKDGDRPKRVSTDPDSPFYGEVILGDVIMNKFGNLNMGHWWGLLVYNYDVGSVQIWNVKQKTIQIALCRLDRSKDWGDFRKYDVEIELAEDGKSYTVMPMPKSQMTDKIESSIKERVGSIDLDALYSTEENPYGGDPFQGELEELTDEELKEADRAIKKDEIINPDDLPFG